MIAAVAARIDQQFSQRAIARGRIAYVTNGLLPVAVHCAIFARERNN